MVKNSNEKLRMKTNYTDLYKACPIDSYPLPSKDFLVDEASKFSILSFSYAYFEYNNNTYVLVGWGENCIHDWYNLLLLLDYAIWS